MMSVYPYPQCLRRNFDERNSNTVVMEERGRIENRYYMRVNLGSLEC